MEPDELGETEELLRERGWPKALIKACVDPFDYAMGLADGSTLRFELAVEMGLGGWVHLTGVRDVLGPLNAWRYSFERGLDVQVSHIVWVCDAPQGS